MVVNARCPEEVLRRQDALRSFGNRVARFVAAVAMPLAADRFGVEVCFMFWGVLGLVATIVWTAYVMVPADTRKHDCAAAAAVRAVRGADCAAAAGVVGIANTDGVLRAAVKSVTPKSVTLFGADFWRLALLPGSLALYFTHLAANFMNEAVEQNVMRLYQGRFELPLEEATTHASLPKLAGFLSPFVAWFIQSRIASGGRQVYMFSPLMYVCSDEASGTVYPKALYLFRHPHF
jgi:hypothetical protein